MKKLFAMLLSAAMVLSFAACGAPTTSEPKEDPAAPATDATAPAATPEASAEPEKSADGKYELALITDVGTIDDKSFNQGAWEGLEKYAKEKTVSSKYYKPAEKTTDAYLAAIELAITGGAKLIVCPGFLFEPAVYQAQELHKDVMFVLLDGSPNDGTTYKTAENTYSIKYAEQEAGFLAGYAAVKDGYKKLGFMGGMAVPAVVRYGYGFVQGADAAAKEMGLAKDEVSVKYKYLGTFEPSAESQTEAASWFQGGIEVIFASAGGAGNSVMAAATASTGKVIGVDVDQSAESDAVITSSMKELGNSVYDSIDMFYKGSFPGGIDAVLGAKDDCVGLPMDTSRFKAFAAADYDTLYKKLATDEGGISSGLATDTTAADATKVPVELVKVELAQ